MSEVIDFITEYPEVPATVIVIIAAIIAYLLLRWLLGRSMRRNVYLCIDHFIRNCHEQSFYSPTHNEFSEYVPLYKKLNRRKTGW